MTIIRLEARYGFANNTRKHCIDIIEKILKVPRNGIIKFDLSNLEFVYLDVIIILVSLVDYLEKHKDIRFCLVKPKSDPVLTFFSECGLLDKWGLDEHFFKISKYGNNPHSYEIHYFTQTDDDEIDKILDVIQRQLNISLQVKCKIHETVSELVLNVMAHSSAGGCYIIAQGYPKSGRVRFCIGDIGIGIKAHITKRFPRLKDKDSIFLIRFALRDGITGALNNDHSGAGLPFLQELIRLCGGEFQIMSGEGLYMERTEGITSDEKKIISEKVYSKLDFCYPGTFISATIECNPKKTVVSTPDDVSEKYKLL